MHSTTPGPEPPGSDSMELRTLKGIDPEELLNVFNESFSDYFVPFHLTPEQLNVKLRAEKINFDFSAGAFVDKKLVGFILHGFDTIDGKKVIYNGGTGVIPSQRKQGLTKQMYHYLLPVLRAEHIDTLVLEVIKQNIAAIKSYEKVGYHVERKLVCYKGEINTTGAAEIEIKELIEYDWEKLRSFWDFSPAWQNSINVLEELKNTNKSYGAFAGNQLTGYIVYNPLNKRVQQFAVDAGYRRKKIASTLFNFIGKQYGRNVTIINVDESSAATNAFLLNSGLENFTEQLEMKLDIT